MLAARESRRASTLATPIVSCYEVPAAAAKSCAKAGGLGTTIGAPRREPKEPGPQRFFNETGFPAGFLLTPRHDRAIVRPRVLLHLLLGRFLPFQLGPLSLARGPFF